MADPKVAALKPEELLSTHNGRREQAAVTPAQHPVTMGGTEPIGVGKSWSRASGEPQLDEHDLPVPTYVPWLGKTVEHPEHYGIYFQERWDEALACDPEFLYINDWTSGRPANTSPAAKVRQCPGPPTESFLFRRSVQRRVQPLHSSCQGRLYR